MNKENEKINSTHPRDLGGPQGSGICSYKTTTTDPRQKPSGERQRLGFTLIELLVVVLIIGILAAVAVPQYQKAVEKSKAAQAQTLLKSVYQAAQAYKLATGNWPTNFDELAVEIPWTGTVSTLTGSYATLSNEDWSLEMTYDGIWVIRNSGPYISAGFAILYRDSVEEQGPSVPNGDLMCVEGHRANSFLQTFNSTHQTGDYCRKIMKGTELMNTSANRWFAL